MNPLHSVGARLSAALLLVVAVVLGVVYLVVVPSLENRLVGAKISQLQASAEELGGRLPADRVAWPDFVESAQSTANARVVIFDVISPPLAVTVYSDSQQVDSRDVEHDRVALEAAQRLTEVYGTVTRADERYAEVAVPTNGGQSVLLVTASLHDSLGNVHLVQRRLLIAGGIGLLLALGLGYGGSWAFARRLRRLERAADRIASGRFDESVVDRHDDEVGQLAQAFERMRRRLAQLDHARREFVANASHELRTPVFSLGGFLELMADEELPEETRREFLDSMREQVERLAKLATELLDLSRMDAGQLHVGRETVSLAAVGHALADEFAAVALRSGHALDVEAEGDVAAVGDEQRILQIGRALVENALRHTPPGTPVRIRAESTGGGSRLAVEDAGPGISVEQVGQVFDRFYRVEGGKASGSGLGLAIGRQLAELMDGKLELQSEPGRTRFTLSLRKAPLPALRAREAVTRP